MQISSAMSVATQGIQQAQLDLQKAADRILSSTKAIMRGDAAPQLVDGGLRFMGMDGDIVTISAQAMEAWDRQSLAEVFIDARMATYAFDGNLEVVEASQKNFASLLGIVA
jgi:hypothetical protein